MSTVVIYHKADYDGIFCREIAKRFLPADTTFIGWDYGDPEPVVSNEDTLYILDLSVPGLMSHPKLIWIDHHKSAMDKYHDKSIVGYRIDGVAACRLAWQWFRTEQHIREDSIKLPDKVEFVERDVTEPLAVRLAGEYDIWDKRDERAELFQHGLRSQELTPEIWERLFNHRSLGGWTEVLLRQGGVLQYARRKEDASTILAFGFTTSLGGLTLLACNVPKCNSLFFTAGVKPEHDGCFAFHWTGKHWRCSLYGVPHKPDVDLSTLAVFYGGGGHKQACGFTCAVLPISLK